MSIGSCGRAIAAAALTAVLAIGLSWAHAQPLSLADTARGEVLYMANCAVCHQPGGAGIESAFPPLRGHVPELVASLAGRNYLASVVLNGLAGTIEVSGRSYNGVMPPWLHLGDRDIAAVLDYITGAWGNAALLPDGFQSFSPEEIARARSAPLDSASLLAMRESLGLDHRRPGE